MENRNRVDPGSLSSISDMTSLELSVPLIISRVVVYDIDVRQHSRSDYRDGEKEANAPNRWRCQTRVDIEGL